MQAQAPRSRRQGRFTAILAGLTTLFALATMVAAAPVVADVAPPAQLTVTVKTPPAGATYRLGKVARADFSCTSPTAITLCQGSAPDGGPIDTAQIGPHVFTVAAADLGGQTAQAQRPYQVVYTFNGFNDPVASTGDGILNVANAGDLLKLGFGLDGNRGPSVLAGGSPTSTPITCPPWPTQFTPAAGPGSTPGLSFASHYSYGWQTNPEWANTCRLFTLQLIDGTVHTASFRFVPPPTALVPGTVSGVQFSQLDLYARGDLFQADSGYGLLDVTFVGAARLLYLNVSVNGAWAIRNIPVRSLRGKGVTQTMSYSFDAGTPGVPTPAVAYGLTLTTGTSTGAPETVSTAPVADGRGGADVCKGGDPPSPTPARPGPLVGGRAAEDGRVPDDRKSTFPNQEAGSLECGPVAVSNSLQWLNAKHKLGMTDADTSIGTAKTATGFPNAAGLAPVDWFTKKDAYMKANNLPIETTTVPVGDVAAKLKEDCDVELDGKTHIAAVVGITALEGGKYSIDVRHDTDQGNAGGTKDETVTFDPATNTVTGGKWLDGKGVDNFVVECPKKK